MRVFKSTFRDRKGKTTKTANWYIEFQDHRGTTRRLAAFTSKSASEELGRNIDKLSSYARATGGQVDPALQQWVSTLPKSILSKLVTIGLVKTDRVAVSKPLTEHLNDYIAALAAKGNTEKHVRLSKARIQRVFDGCGFKYWDDISASKVQAFLDGLRQGEEDADGEPESGISAQTFNYYLGSLKAFARWMVKDRRAFTSPLSHLEILNTRVDRRHERRPLTPAELRRLIQAAERGESLFGRDRAGVISWRMTGMDRGMLYRLAVETGLRAGELRSLTPASFDLNDDLPTVKVLAAYSKHRRDDTLPLVHSTVYMLREYLQERELSQPLFKLPRREELASMLRVDLEAAGIPYRDASNRVVDFHALRHTFITNLAQGGVHPKTAQALARHSTITLTMDRYSHSGRQDEARALSALPDLSGPGEEDEEGQSVSAVYLARQARQGENTGDAGRRNGHPETQRESAAKHGRNGDNPMGPEGFEPSLPDEGKRILSPLRLPFRHGAEEDSSVESRFEACGAGED
jgi:integrase